MPISRIDAAAFHYLQSWNVKAVAISPTGKVYATNDPTGATIAWWCADKDAIRLARAAEATGDVLAAACRLGIRITPHEVAVARARERALALDAALRQAQEAGLLKAFNERYRDKRLEAFRHGKSFMPYPAARARLTQVMMRTVAQGGALTSSLVEQALTLV